MIVGTRQGGLSISETADLLGFSCTESLEFAENGAKTSSEQQFCRQKRFVNDQTGQSWQEGDSNANKHALQQWYAEEHRWTPNIGYSSRRVWSLAESLE